MLSIPPGRLDARAGQAAYDAVVAAAKLALAGKVDAITTAPLQKEALHRAGHAFPGHTELLASLCGVENFAMMLYLGPDGLSHSPAGLAVVHVTLHTALRNVFDELTEDGVLAKALLADDFMTRLTASRPRIGICALNPHGGEGGLFGRRRTDDHRTGRPAGQGIGARSHWPAAHRHADGPRPRRSSSTPWWPCITTRGISP